jgi:hypothetical protein
MRNADTVPVARLCFWLLVFGIVGLVDSNQAFDFMGRRYWT